MIDIEEIKTKDNLFINYKNLTDEQKIFIYCYSFTQKNMKYIENILKKFDSNKTYQDVQQLVEECKTYTREIQNIRNKFNSKKKYLKEEKFKFRNFEEFYNWFLDETNNGKVCCYCGVEEKDLMTYFNKNNEQYKEARQRGQFLEIERILTAPDKNIYSIENCALACYICNNAKSDFLSAKSFKPIAKGINIFWNKVMNKDKDLTDEKLFDLTVKFPKTDIWEKE